jgi:hypothetical protein
MVTTSDGSGCGSNGTKVFCFLTTCDAQDHDDCHGNSKHIFEPYRRTNPNIMEKAAIELQNKKPGQVYREMVLTSDGSGCGSNGTKVFCFLTTCDAQYRFCFKNIHLKPQAYNIVRFCGSSLS